MSLALRAVTPSINSWSAEYLEAQYQAFKADPGSIPDDLRSFFQGFDLAVGSGRKLEPVGAAQPLSGESLRFHAAVAEMIENYRTIGHIAAKLDPFGREQPRPRALTLAYYGLTEADLDRTVNAAGLPVGSTATVRTIIEFLERTYCGAITLQSAHITDADERHWLLARFEKDAGRIPLSRGNKAHILERLLQAEQFEKFLGKRYGGEKRFSSEGAESMIPLLDHLIEAGAELGIEEMVFGMAHRGRLTVLNTIFGKTYEQLFTEFEDSWNDSQGPGVGGDVKYHRGYSGERALRAGRTMYLAMQSNPSHLEAVNPVVLGRCRGKQRLRGDAERTRVAPVLLHGDAAFIGQGIVPESLNLSKLEGYRVGGCIHVVINNLIGFTTRPQDGRSSRYCTDIALGIEAPVIHVNAEDPEAVVAAAQFAAEYRQKFRKDVLIDMVCYRRYGHNEQDEASFTQPLLTKLIKDKQPVLGGYSQRLRAEGVISEADLAAIEARMSEQLDRAQRAAQEKPHVPVIDPGSKRWAGVSTAYTFDPVPTGVPEAMLREVCAALGRVPDGFNMNPKLRPILEARAALPKTRAISYADAESLAFGTLLLEGHGLRLTGQDCRRGTFSHRHAVLRDTETEEMYTPLNSMRPIARVPDEAGRPDTDGRPTQGRLCVYDSALSEEAVMGFEYGYSLSDPRMMVMWEAQFGDFANGAQMIIDQFIASGDIKWGRWSGLVLLLPHGFEGLGPEHSSSRPERFLQLCGNDSMIVVNPSTGAQCFHVFRRQLKAPYRKPLIVMTPKSMLRVQTSVLDELTTGCFEHMLDDPLFTGGFGGAGPKADRGKVRRVCLCSGKIYHDLAARRALNHATDTALVRVEQLYPFDGELMKRLLALYPAKAEKVWAQEEPRNQGAYLFVADELRQRFGIDLGYHGRPTAASPAVGSKNLTKQQQEELVAHLFGDAPDKAGAASHAGPAGNGLNGAAASATSAKNGRSAAPAHKGGTPAGKSKR